MRLFCAKTERACLLTVTLSALTGFAGIAAPADAAFVTNVSGVYDEQTSQLNTVDATASGTASGVTQVPLATFTADMAAAFAAGTGGVIHFDDITNTGTDKVITAGYGSGGMLTITETGMGNFQMDMSQLGTINATPISGSRYLRHSSGAPFNFRFDTPLQEVGLTVLARNGSRTIDATVGYNDGTTGTLNGVAVASFPTSSGVAPTAASTPDTFFGFTAPAGKYITSLSMTAGTDAYFVTDDMGFVVPEPASLATIGMLGFGLLGRRRRR